MAPTLRREMGIAPTLPAVMAEPFRYERNHFFLMCQISQIWLRSGELPPKRVVWPM